MVDASQVRNENERVSRFADILGLALALAHRIIII